MKLNFLPSQDSCLHRNDNPDNLNQTVMTKKWLWIPLVAIFFIVLLFAGLATGFALAYENRILPGVYVANMNLSGLNRKEATAAINLVTDKISQSGIQVLYKENGDNYLKVAPIIESASDPDLSREIITFNNEQTIDNAFAVGRNGNWLNDIVSGGRAFLAKTKLSADVEINNEALKKILQDQFADLEKPGQDAKPEIIWEDFGHRINIVGEQNGVSFDYDKAISIIANNLKSLNSQPVTIDIKSKEATINTQEAEASKGLLETVLSTSTALYFEDNEWQLTPKTLATMLEFQKTDGEIKAGINFEGWEKWVEKNLASEINIEPRDARIEMSSTTPMKIISHKSGRKINMEKTYQDINGGLSGENRRVEITVQEDLPKITIDNVNNLGIKEIIGAGHSNFAGSPNNRRHNIKTGAGKLQGVLIKPGEEFSLITTLGDIDGSTGYLPELVIKGNKTTPEFGGGLCQIGTTVFRAAMDSGLPITERHNHSYSVTYYLENGLPGVDATIYQPHPDVRFKNDTGNHILIQYAIKGNDLTFEFWGTKDGRKAERTKPKVWGWVSPAPTKMVETTELAPGVKKCTETSHKGVNASFDYSVTYPTGDVKKQTFTSHYKPWQAVCLIGVDKTAVQATTTPAIVE